MMKLHSRIPRVLHIPFHYIILLTLMCSVGGCADLQAIRNFADQSVDAAQHQKLVNEYAEAPRREKLFQPASQQATLDNQTKERQAQKEQLLARLKAVEEYMKAMGNLAADDAVNYDKNVDAVGKALKDAKFADAKQVDAIGTISKLLLKAVADGWRQKQLHDLIAEANQPLQIVLAAQADIVGKDFADSLRNEETTIANFYDNFLRTPDALKEPVGGQALREWQASRLESFPGRKKAVASYAQALRKIAAGHQELYDNRNKLDAKDLLKRIEQYAKDLKTILNAVKDL